MPALFDLLYREYCRARLAEMRKVVLETTPLDHGALHSIRGRRERNRAFSVTDNCHETGR
jgi:hypothetical protein